MFCTFTTDQGTLIIRTEDVRRIEDEHVRADATRCAVEWTPNGVDLHIRHVDGTARENLDRLRDEEIKAIEAAQKLQSRPVQPPLPRGIDLASKRTRAR